LAIILLGLVWIKGWHVAQTETFPAPAQIRVERLSQCLQVDDSLLAPGDDLCPALCQFLIPKVKLVPAASTVAQYP
jgi:hypothetical protein